MNRYNRHISSNIISINDDSPDAAVGGVTGQGLERDFYYDGLYRLLKATGRENVPYTSFPAWDDTYRDDTDSSTVAYTQKYAYDEMGNIQTLNNTATGNSYTRTYSYATGHNLLTGFTAGGNTYSYTYDENGNIISENLDREFGWDYADRMVVFANQVTGIDPTVYTNYLYDAAGNRVKKFTQKAGGVFSSVTYIDSLFEYQTNNSAEKQNTLHIMDNKARIATHRIGDAMGDTTPAIKYILSDHLGSSNVLVEAVYGTVINREEYYPFGETSFGSYTKKRYRFCGKEKDEESGLYYYGARYYCPWLCRFNSTDPLGGINVYQSSYVYADDNPLMYNDPTGMASESSGGGDNKNPDKRGNDSQNRKFGERGWVSPKTGPANPSTNGNKNEKGRYPDSPGGKDKWPDKPSLPPDRSPSPRGTVSPLEAAHMAINVYHDTNIAPIGGWGISALKIPVEYNNKTSGFKSALYERKRDDGSMEYAYVTAGTDSGWAMLKDYWHGNIPQAFGANADQYEQSVENAKAISKALEGQSLTFIGHSLGGGLAVANAMATGRDAITFNAAHLTEGNQERYKDKSGNSNIDAYVLKGEVLDKYHNKTNGLKYYIYPSNVSCGALERHKMINVIESMINSGYK